MVVGDTHGHDNVIESKAKIAKRLGADRMLIVGDFGVWPGHGGVKFLDKVSQAGEAYDILIYALPGNHEDHDQWAKWLDMGLPQDGSKFTYVRSNLLLSPRIHNWKWGKKRFFIAGGAASIDRRWRREGVSWWRDEMLSEAEVMSVEKYKGPEIDYLFTHDCSNYTPWGFQLVPDPDSQEHRRKVDRIVRAVRPRMHFHGHMHHRYEWENWYNGLEDRPTITYGLDCDGESDSWGILDTDLDEFYWPTQAVAKFDPAFTE
jgi:hypothetical protein